MYLSELDQVPSFALLGPGFGGDPFMLYRELSPKPQGDALLVFAPFDEPGCSARKYSARSAGSAHLMFDGGPVPELHVELVADDHAQQVEQIRAAIASGDVYQVCLTVRAHIAATCGADLLRCMCHHAVPRFAAWVRLPDGQEFVSASPELFFETDGRSVHAEPMKGTARPEAGSTLASSEKDRCELAMITDLLRNDLHQLCCPGTVRVANERRVVELPYALQSVSDVVGTLPEGVTPLNVLAVLHPGGSVTGAPKQAALTMIRALEHTPRGAYCGSLGIMTGQRSIFSLLIRTASKSAAGWMYGVGGGIVFDSDPHTELDELNIKLGALRCPTRS